MMENLLDDFRLWISIGFLTYLLLQIFVIHVENDYRREFALSTIGFWNRWRSTCICGSAFLIICWFSQEALPSITCLPLSIASAALVGVWRVDRELFLIPDRFQLMGLVSAVAFMGCLILTGEDIGPIAVETGFALALVALLWIMSIIYFRIRGVVGFGFGDIKLLGWLAFFVGKRMPNLVLISVVIGFAFLALASVRKSLSAGRVILPGAQDALAFGPAIVVGFFIESWTFYG